jgi:hypothetical protein
MQGKDNWIGYEVEGRYFGILTKFIRYHIGEIPEGIFHLYFTREYLLKYGVQDIEKYLFGKYIITIECNKESYNLITPNMKVKCHIIYRIEDAIPFDLKETDSIFIDKDTYNVLCYNKYQAYKVNPIDYSKDIINDNN